MTLAAVVSLPDPPTLAHMLKYVPTELAHRVGPYLSGLNRDQKNAISGLQSRLALITESAPCQYPARRTRRRSPPRPCGCDEVVLFSLNAARYGKLGAQIAALVIQDLTAVSGYRLGTAHRPLGFVAIDEFSALDADNVLALLDAKQSSNDGRSAAADLHTRTAH